MPTSRTASRFLVAAIALVITAAAGWLYIRRQYSSISPFPSAQTNAQAMAVLPRSSGEARVSADIAAAAQLLSQTSRAEEATECLNRLRNRLIALGTNAASITVQHALNAGVDAPTHLGFKLGRNGQLIDAPTLRLFLIEHLTQIDPKAAAAAAEKLMRSPGSADEWAVGLRAYALGSDSPEMKSFLRQKARELLRNEAWRAQPSVGFLEAFDVVVYTRDSELTPELAAWARQTNDRALSHAAFLTLDRMVQETPVEMLNRLQAQPDLLTGREAMRADFFARADVRDAQQRQVLEKYLLDPLRSEVEWKAFAAIYPNANYRISYNLLTQSRTPGGAEIAARDREALRVTQEWLADPRFAHLGAHLQTIRGRLEQFVKPVSPPQ